MVQAAPASAPTTINVPSRLTAHRFSVDITDTLYNYRVLRMNQSLLIYIGPAEQETFQEMAVAMPSTVGTAACIGTTIMGDPLGISLELATNFAKRLQKQVFVSCNVPAEREIRPALVRRFAEEVDRCPEHF